MNIIITIFEVYYTLFLMGFKVWEDGARYRKMVPGTIFVRSIPRTDSLGNGPYIGTLVYLGVEESVEQEFICAVRLGPMLAPKSDEHDVSFLVFHIYNSSFSCDLVFP